MEIRFFYILLFFVNPKTIMSPKNYRKKRQ